MSPVRSFTCGVILSIAVGTAAGTAEVAATLGKFLGNIVVKWSEDGRDMVLMQPFTFIDPSGLNWTAPEGTKTDGASVPRVLWSLYGPFEGKYREAAVLHDYYCESQLRTWQATHNMFYDAMRASGVSERDAKIMWAAVYSFGPRWGIEVQTRGPGGSAYPALDDQKAYMHAIAAWIDRDDPSRSALAMAIDQAKVPLAP